MMYQPKTREEIITSMCYTWRHDYGAPFVPWTEVFNCTEDTLPEGVEPGSGIGMSFEERKQLWDQMAQIFDNDIYPNMEFKK